ncbi:acyl carrier protein [Micromonospora sp. RTGN7]|uniref:acyl carrier protein n=1 Tax=Micromonospora sp. RTGN7 TaxID=3016526 RepID=UPI0029FF06DA|nr:acyl carrier protein [Micromonospora sp. RTGN7]
MTEQHTPAQQTGNDEAVLRIVADVLKVPHVALTDSFYDFGGTSLQAMRICARLGKELGVRISPEVLFDSDTLADVISATEA